MAESRRQSVMHHMHVFRRLATEHACFAALLLAATLLVRGLVPAGYMPAAQDGKMVVMLCSAPGSSETTVTLPIDHRDTSHHHRQQPDHPCAFGSLAGSALAATEPTLLLAAILFAFVAAIFWRPLILPRQSGQILPPLRGPPTAR